MASTVVLIYSSYRRDLQRVEHVQCATPLTTAVRLGPSYSCNDDISDSSPAGHDSCSQHALICRPGHALCITREKGPNSQGNRATGKQGGGGSYLQGKRQSNTLCTKMRNITPSHTSYCSPFCHALQYLPNVPVASGVPASHRRLLPSYFLRNSIHCFEHHTWHTNSSKQCKHHCHQLGNDVRARTSRSCYRGEGGALVAQLLR